MVELILFIKIIKATFINLLYSRVGAACRGPCSGHVWRSMCGVDMNMQRHLCAGQKTGCRSWFFPSMIWVLEIEFRFLGSAATILMPHWSPDIAALNCNYWDFRWCHHTHCLVGFVFSIFFFRLLWMGHFYWCFLGRFVISIQTWQWFYILISSPALLSNIFIKLKSLLWYLFLHIFSRFLLVSLSKGLPSL